MPGLLNAGTFWGIIATASPRGGPGQRVRSGPDRLAAFREQDVLRTASGSASCARCCTGGMLQPLTSSRRLLRRCLYRFQGGDHRAGGRGWYRKVATSPDNLAPWLVPPTVPVMSMLLDEMSNTPHVGVRACHRRQARFQ